MKKIVYISAIAMLCYHSSAVSQNNYSWCDSVRNYYKNIIPQSPDILSFYLEKAPSVITKKKNKSIKILDPTVNNTTDKYSRVIVDFIVKKDGSFDCLLFLYPKEMLYADEIKELLSKQKFSPAVYKGNVVDHPITIQVKIERVKIKGKIYRCLSIP